MSEGGVPEGGVPEGVSEGGVPEGGVPEGGTGVSDWNTLQSPSKYFFMISSISC